MVLLPVSLVVFLGTMVLMAWHVRGWREARQEDLPPQEYDFRRRQFYRRALTTGLMGLVAAALPFTVEVMRAWPRAGVAYVLGLLAALVGIGLLALADMWSIRWYYSRLRDQHQLEQTRLAAEWHRQGQAQGNGRVWAKPNGQASPGPEAN